MSGPLIRASAGSGHARLAARLASAPRTVRAAAKVEPQTSDTIANQRKGLDIADGVRADFGDACFETVAGACHRPVPLGDLLGMTRLGGFH